MNQFESPCWSTERFMQSKWPQPPLQYSTSQGLLTFKLLIGHSQFILAYQMSTSECADTQPTKSETDVIKTYAILHGVLW